MNKYQVKKRKKKSEKTNSESLWSLDDNRLCFLCRHILIRNLEQFHIIEPNPWKPVSDPVLWQHNALKKLKGFHSDNTGN